LGTCEKEIIYMFLIFGKGKGGEKGTRRIVLCKTFVLRDVNQFLGRSSYPTCVAMRVEKIKVSNDGEEG
jgi:hypothetical protein